MLDNLACEGNEDHLFVCPHNGEGVHNCDSNHFDDAGVACTGMSSVRVWIHLITCSKIGLHTIVLLILSVPNLNEFDHLIKPILKTLRTL